MLAGSRGCEVEPQAVREMGLSGMMEHGGPRALDLMWQMLRTEASAQLNLERFRKETTIAQNKKAIQLLKQGHVIGAVVLIVVSIREQARVRLDRHIVLLGAVMKPGILREDVRLVHVWADVRLDIRQRLVVPLKLSQNIDDRHQQLRVLLVIAVRQFEVLYRLIEPSARIRAFA